jgi:ABC-type nickel/cobalt efflux system permease component RcnA
VKRIWTDMNPTLRGFLVLAVIALIVVVLQLQATLSALFILARIAFFLAIAFFIYLVWRERRSDIATWARRSQVVFYGAALLMVVDLGVYIWRGAGGLDALAFVLVLLIGGFSMWRVWRDAHSY